MRFYKKIYLSLLLLCVASCSVGHDFVKLVTTNPLSFKRNEVPDTPENKEIEAAWWKAYESEEINALVDLALKNNPTIEAVSANLNAAKQNVIAQQGFFFPTIGANLNSSRQSVGNSLSPNASGSATLYSLHIAELNIGYTPDIFGANQRQVESLKSLANAQKYSLDALKITIVNNVVTAAIQEASLREEIKFLEESTEASRLQLEHAKRMMQTGYANDIDLAGQESLYQQSLSQIPLLKKTHEQTLDLLNLLCGKLPDEILSVSNIKDIHTPPSLPNTLPSQLVSHRPDIKVAEEMMRASNAQIGYTIANMLPQISITGLGGSAASKFGDLSKGGNAIWALAGNASQTIFSGGTLLARKRSAEASYESAVAQYKYTVLTAFQNVADALRALDEDTQTLNAQAQVEAISKEALELSTKQYQLGATSYLSLLDAQRTYQQALIGLITAKAARYADTAALFQSLGGGWWTKSTNVSHNELNQDLKKSNDASNLALSTPGSINQH